MPQTMTTLFVRTLRHLQAWRRMNPAAGLTRQERLALILIATLFALGAAVRWLRLRGGA